jgi:DNA invertase Pin-like site-specific DNA recombinase
VLEPAIETAGPMGRMVLSVLGMVAEMELGFVRDRQRGEHRRGEGEALLRHTEAGRRRGWGRADGPSH